MVVCDNSSKSGLTITVSGAEICRTVDYGLDVSFEPLLSLRYWLRGFDVRHFMSPGILFRLFLLTSTCEASISLCR